MSYTPASWTNGDSLDEIEADYGLGTAQRIKAARNAIAKVEGKV